MAIDESSPQYTKIMDYIEAHPTAVIGSINDDGTPHAATVYIATASHHTVCFVTRNLSRKYQNMYQRPAVSVTIYDDRETSTLQASGIAFVSNDDHMLNYMQAKMNKAHATRSDSLPPIDKLRQAGDYVLIGIELKTARLAEYRGMDVNSREAFTEISE